MILRLPVEAAGPIGYFGVWPLCRAGPVTFACEWAAAGIAEARADLGAQLILDAAGQSVALWPNGNR